MVLRRPPASQPRREEMVPPRRVQLRCFRGYNRWEEDRPPMMGEVEEGASGAGTRRKLGSVTVSYGVAIVVLSSQVDAYMIALQVHMLQCS